MSFRDTQEKANLYKGFIRDSQLQEKGVNDSFRRSKEEATKKYRISVEEMKKDNLKVMKSLESLKRDCEAVKVSEMERLSTKNKKEALDNEINMETERKKITDAKSKISSYKGIIKESEALLLSLQVKEKHNLTERIKEMEMVVTLSMQSYRKKKDELDESFNDKMTELTGNYNDNVNNLESKKKEVLEEVKKYRYVYESKLQKIHARLNCFMQSRNELVAVNDYLNSANTDTNMRITASMYERQCGSQMPAKHTGFMDLEYPVIQGPHSSMFGIPGNSVLDSPKSGKPISNGLPGDTHTSIALLGESNIVNNPIELKSPDLNPNTNDNGSGEEDSVARDNGGEDDMKVGHPPPVKKRKLRRYMLVTRHIHAHVRII